MALAALAHAQTDTSAIATSPSSNGAPLAPIFVTANPLGDAELIAPTAQLSGDALARAKADLARGFVDAAVDVLVAKSLAALKKTKLKRLVVAGGVGANRQLRAALSAAAAKRGFDVHYPDLALCTDNGAMIALAGALRLARWPDQANVDYAFTVKPRWDLASLAR